MNTLIKHLFTRLCFLAVLTLAPLSVQASTYQTFAFDLADSLYNTVGDVTGSLRFNDGGLATFDATIRTNSLTDQSQPYQLSLTGAVENLILDQQWDVRGQLTYNSADAFCATGAVCRLSRIFFAFDAGFVSMTTQESIVDGPLLAELHGAAELTQAPVPLPSAFPLFASALAGIGFFNRKRKNGQALPA